MKRLFMKHPTIYLFIVVLIGILIIYLVDIKLFLIYSLIVYLIDSNIKSNLLKKSLSFLDKKNEVKLWSIGEKVGVNTKDFMKEIEVRSFIGDVEAIETLKTKLNDIFNRIAE